MAVELALGAGLVVLTWVVCGGALLLTGLLPATVLTEGAITRRTLRASIWWGLLIMTICVVGVSLVQPLRSPAAAGAVAAVVLVMAVPGILLARRRGVRTHAAGRPWQWLLLAALALATLYLAAAALGPVTNYDSGLYHLGAIAYAGDYAAVPGLANLYFPLGYANAEFPLAALLGNGPWDGVGFRLLNGLLLALVAVDLVVRARERRLTPGFFVLAVGVAAAWVPMVALSDYWVTSPTSDSAVLALTLVATAYLVDAVAGDRDWGVHAGTSIAISTLLVMLRPTMAVYAVMVVLVLVVRAARGSRRLRFSSPWRAATVIGAAVMLAGLVTTARDYVLSGWLQFPLSVHAFDVDWLAPNPIDVRTATLGAARDPLDLWTAATSWGWIPTWVGGLPSQWETFEFAAIAVVATVLVVLAARSESGLRPSALMLAMVPSAVAVGFWWLFTPPSFRFIWGPLFTLAAIPAGWALWRLSRTTTDRSRAGTRWQWLMAAGVAIPIMAVTAFSIVARFDAGSITEQRTWSFGIQVPYAVTPITDAPVSESPIPSGLTIWVPTESDQCWDNYPLCSPMFPPTLTPRGPTISDGFRP